MALRCRLPLLLRAYASEGVAFTNTSSIGTKSNIHTNNINNNNNNNNNNSQQHSRRSSQSSSSELSNINEITSLRKQLAAAQFRISELQFTQISTHETLIRKLEETDKAAHKTATELRYTALALQCHYDLLETELRRLLAINLNNNNNNNSEISEEEKEDIRRLRLAAIEAGSREMVRKNIGFRVEKVSEEPAAVAKANNNNNNSNVGT